MTSLVLAALIALGFIDQQVTDVLTRERLEPMLAEESPRLIEATFARHPDAVLPFIDSYFEGGLAMIEEGKPEEDARASFRRGLAFAEIAAKAFDDDSIAQYAANFASWSPQEQKIFREGQKQFGAGRSALKDEKLDDARVCFTASRRAASRLGDLWGEAMALEGLASTELKAGRPMDANAAGRRSADLYQRLRMYTTEARVHLLCAEATMSGPSKRAALSSLGRAWGIVGPQPPSEFRTKVRDIYLAAMDREGMVVEAAEIRREEGLVPPESDED